MRDRPEASAASVASVLLAFYREPAAHRPRFLHDPDGIEGGAHVFRFALGKFPPALIRKLPADERVAVRRAACAFIRQVCFWDGANAYQVLALRRDSRIDEVKEHYRLLMALVHPDRHEPDVQAHQAWPTGCVQRANAAYEVLGDSARRAAYDAETRRAPVGAGSASTPRQAAVRRRIPAKRMAITAAVVVVALLTLGAAQLAWLEERDAPDWLPHAMPRGSGDTTHEPRFLSLARASALITEIIQPQVLPSLAAPTPIERSVPSRSPQPATPVENHEVPAVRVASVTHVDISGPAPAAPLRQERALTASSTVVPQAAVAAQPAVSASTASKEVEILLAKLVSYYESGDIDRFMTLFEPNGYWNSMQTRSTYESFFRATSQRRLRIENLSWNTVDRTAFARGHAEVVVDYKENSPRLDRKVDVEIDIALRDDGARISRLSLYPNGP